MPQEVGSRNPSAALIAIAASTAEPPRLRMSIPIWVASGCALPAAPCVPYTAVREAKLAPNGRSPAATSGRLKRASPFCHFLGRLSAGGGAPPCPGPSAMGGALGVPVCASAGPIMAAAGREARKVRRRKRSSRAYDQPSRELSRAATA
jgi:hypothetical protein